MDDGKISGRGGPLLRGGICGLMTTLGGIGHTLPYLISNFRTATSVALFVVVVELAAISWIRWRYMETSPLAATTQVAIGGALVFAAGWLIGSNGRRVKAGYAKSFGSADFGVHFRPRDTDSTPAHEVRIGGAGRN